MDIDKKLAAKQFLAELHKRLNARLPPAEELRAEIAQMRLSAASDDTKKHLASPEFAFFNSKVIPELFTLMQEASGLAPSILRKSLFCEFWNNEEMQPFCEKSASRTVLSPFIKSLLGEDEARTFAAWRSGRMERACPDFATGGQFKHSIVFEGKYFEKGNAEKTLISLVREVQLYRSFPAAPGNRIKGEWNYEFACAIACDSSDKALLRKKWEEIPEPVKDGFWDGANIYVMIVRRDSD